VGFETPLALLALVAAGLPILAHLVRRRDLPRQPLPTIALLQAAAAASRRRVRLVDFLLLAVRVGLVAVAVLAVAGPVRRLVLQFGDGRVASVGIVVDDSLSMSGRGLVEEARDRAVAILRSLPPGSEVAVVRASAPGRVLVHRTDDLAAALRALRALDVEGEGGTAYPRAIELAEREMAGAAHAPRRLVVLGDFAAHGALREARLPDGFDLSFERFGEDAPLANAGITSARSAVVPGRDDRASISVEVRARDLAGESPRLTARRGDALLAETTVELGEAGGRATLEVPVDRERPAVSLELEVEDALDADDRRTVLVRGAAGARVLVVDGDPQPVRAADEVRYLTRAIQLAPSTGGALFAQVVDPDTFATRDLADVDVVVLANVAALSRDVAARVRAFVEGGGGLLVTAGGLLDVRAYRAGLASILPGRLGSAVDGEIAGPRGLEGAAPFGEGADGLGAARTQRRLLFEPRPGAETALTFEDGTPALVLGEAGDGRVAVLTTSVDDDDSTLCLQPGFLPLMVRLLRRLSPTRGLGDAPRLPGEAVRFRPPPGTVRVDVRTPSGAVLRATPEADEVRFEATGRSGAYEVEVVTTGAPQRVSSLAWVIAPPASESDLSPGEVPEDRRADGDAAVTPRRTVDRPLDPWFFLAVGLLALAEAVLRRRRLPGA
jgi:hypothetical protein